MLQEIPARFLLPKETFGSPEALWELTGKALILVFIFKHNLQYPQALAAFPLQYRSAFLSLLERRDHVYSSLLLAARCRSKAALPLTNLESSMEQDSCSAHSEERGSFSYTFSSRLYWFWGTGRWWPWEENGTFLSHRALWRCWVFLSAQEWEHELGRQLGSAMPSLWVSPLLPVEM